MSYLLSIDPGTRCVGFACWTDGKLIYAGLSKAPKELKDYRDMLVHHEEYLRGFAMYGMDSIAVEVMVHRFKRKVDPNDLLHLNLIAGKLGNLFYEPSDWKGGVSRKMEQKRTWLALSAEEKEVLPCDLKYILDHPSSEKHNVFSAVGIGLSVLKRAHLKCGIIRERRK